MYNMYNTYIYIFIYIYIYLYIAIYIQGFPCWGDEGSPHYQPKICSFPLATKFVFPPHQKSVQPNKKMKLSFLAVPVLTAPVPFLF